jgi:hypothetical protein
MNITGNENKFSVTIKFSNIEGIVEEMDFYFPEDYNVEFGECFSIIEKTFDKKGNYTVMYSSDKNKNYKFLANEMYFTIYKDHKISELIKFVNKNEYNNKINFFIEYIN